MKLPDGNETPYLLPPLALKIFALEGLLEERDGKFFIGDKWVAMAPYMETESVPEEEVDFDNEGDD